MHLTEKDQMVLESYKSVLDGLAEYLGSGYEFVLHSLEHLDNSVIKIVNGEQHSGRTVGAPITNLALNALKQIEEKNCLRSMSYFTYSKKGEPLKSTTIPIKGESERVIGLLCINFYLSTPLSTILKEFSSDQQQEHIHESYQSSAADLLEEMVMEAKRSILLNPEIKASNQTHEIIRILYEKGVFRLKNSVPQVAELLVISPNTVYMHLRQFKQNQ